MTSQKIYLFRHGEPAKEYHHKYIGHLDTPLSEAGEKQAQSISRFISKLKNPKIITSDLQRTFSGLHLPLLKKNELREIYFGAWEGLSWAEIERQFPQKSKLFLKTPTTFAFPTGESYSHLSARVIPQFDKLLEEQNENIVFVIHAGVIRTIISEKFNIPLREVLRFEIEYGKCTILSKKKDVFYLNCLNKIPD